MLLTFTSFAEFKRRYPIRPNDEGMLLGSGSYGRVIKVEDQVDTEWVAVKISEFKGNDAKSLKAEVDLAQRVPRHSNIARYDACYRLETDTSVSDFAIMKYYPDGNLADLLRHVKLTPAQVYDLTKGILTGLRHLHAHHIVHRDFKPANILISRDSTGCFIPKIADFGLSKLVSDGEFDGSDFDLSDGRGTPSYKAPEQIEGSKVSFNLDLWAFGVILFEIMTGEKPFRVDQRAASEQSARREIEKKIVTVALPASLDRVAEPYNTLIRRCLVRDIRERVRREDELLDLLDRIGTLLTEARTLLDRGQYDDALGRYEQVLAKRENHHEAQQGIDQCRQAIEKQWIAVLLRQAESLLESGQPQQAEKQFDEVLRLAPAHKPAIEGKARCISLLLPKPVGTHVEQTDVYEEAQTDMYPDVPRADVPRADVPRADVPPPAALRPGVKRTVKPDSAATGLVAESAEPVIPLSRPVVPAGISITRPFPWRIVAPVAAGFIGLTLYLGLTARPVVNTAEAKTQLVDGAIRGPSSTNERESTIPPPLPGPSAVVPENNREALTKRIDAALEKARQAYRQGDYERTLIFTKSALLLDPARRDVAALQKATAEAQQRVAGTDIRPALPAEASKAAPTDPAKPEPTKPPEPDPKAVADAARKEAQQQYDQLIEDGIKSISGGSNNKTKAISAFDEAGKLTKQHDLNTAKADEAYAYALKKGDSYYSRATYDGAKGWYLVAQAAKNTQEIQKQIKLCTNQSQ